VREALADSSAHELTPQEYMCCLDEIRAMVEAMDAAGE